MEFSSDVITIDVLDHVATLWLDRPEARNAFGSTFWRDLPRAAAAIASDRSIRVLIIAAKGPHFTVGLDLKEFGSNFMAGGADSSKAASNTGTTEGLLSMQQAITSITDLEIPVIAAIHGYCIGGGVDLICACDVRLCSGDAIFSIRETKIAIVADLGTLQRLPRIVSAGHVAELAFTGKDFDASRAALIGLVNSVAGHRAEDVWEAARQLAVEIAGNSPAAVRGTKAVLAANEGRTVAEGLDFVAKWNTAHLYSDDLREAMTAFVERRAPVFGDD